MQISKNNLRLFNRLHFVYATASSIQAPRGTGRNGNDGTAMLHASRQDYVKLMADWALFE